MTKRYKVACGKLYITYNADLENEDHCEIFVQSSESGGCQANTKALGMMVAKTLRCGMKPEDVARTLWKVACPACRGKKDLDAKSCPDAIAKAMTELELADGVTIPVESDQERFAEHLKESSRKVAEMPEEQTLLGGSSTKPCPDCGEPMNMESGCWVCAECGYSRCSQEVL